MIEDLSARLAAAGLDPTLYELRDALWLSQHIATPSRPTAPVDEPVLSDVPEDAPLPPAEAVPENVVVSGGTTTEAYGEMYATGAGTDSGLRGVAVRSPAVLALPGQLELARALRPFGRRVPSRRSFEVDEEATAARVAEEGLWAPVLRPASERWLSLTIVVDTAPSMVVWRRTVAELHDLCAWLGAFRRIRVRAFNSVADGPVVDPLHDLDSVRQVVVVVTDGVGAAWHDGRAIALLRGWAGVAPTGVVTVLPQRMWSGTGLHAGAGRVVVPRPAAPNAEWRAEPAGGVPVPVFELSPRWLGLWARLATGSATPQRVALLADPRAGQGVEGGRLDAKGLVRRFRSAASPEAFRLATYLSAAWLTLPVMRLVQRVMLPDSTIAHLAEVFLGGLLQQRGRGSDPEAVEYDFLPEVRAELNGYLLRDDALTVLRETSEFISERLGQPFDFAAMLVDPEGVELPAVRADGGAPMAHIAADVLARLGGRYRALAGRLTTVRGAVSSGHGETAVAVETRYTIDDLWIRPVGARTFRVGITSAGTPAFGALSMYEGSSAFAPGEDICYLHTLFGIRHVNLPVGGRMHSVNHAAQQQEFIPTGEPEGWILEFEAERPGFFTDLLDDNAYRAYLEDKHARALAQFSQELRRLRAVVGYPSLSDIAKVSHYSRLRIRRLFSGGLRTAPPWTLVKNVVTACSALGAKHADAFRVADLGRWRNLHLELLEALGHAPEGEPSPERFFVFLDAEQDRPDSILAIAQEALSSIGVDWTEVIIEISASGLMIILPDDVDGPTLSDSLPGELQNSLRRHNFTSGLHALLSTVHVSTENVALARLDASRVLSALRTRATISTTTTLTVAVSTEFLHAVDVDLTGYQNVEVHTEKFTTEVRIRTFDDPSARRPPLHRDEQAQHLIPRVYISYAYDTPEHVESVLRFATLLRQQGVDARLDLWASDRRRDWAAWAVEQITAADFVVVVASPALRTTRENGLIEQILLRREDLSSYQALHSRRILPVVLPGGSVDDIPAFLRPHTSTHYRLTEFTPEAVEDLVRALIGQPPSTEARSPLLPALDTSNALLVGVARYQALPDLPQVENGLHKLHQRLTGHPEPTFQVDRTPVLINPTGDAFLAEVAEVAAAAEDTLLLYFAGHGLVSSPRGDLLLATSDTRPNAQHTAVSYDSIRRLLARSPARRSVIILDSCFVGRTMKSTEHAGDLAGTPGTLVLASTSDSTAAFAPEHRRYPVFTGALADVLANGEPGDSEYLTMDWIYRGIRRRTPERASAPQLVDYETPPLALGRNPAFQPRDLSAT
ncbi:SAV_2336 N-terminal domain-related protein [Actinosynnema sp. NPDC002837]